MLPTIRACYPRLLCKRANAPDGYLVLREGGGTQYRMKARLRPGELLVADSLGDDWTHIVQVPRLDGREGKRFTQGYLTTKFTKPVSVSRCPYHAVHG